ncbi:MAG: hypothetical protein L3J09_12870 [Flavobacteriaceae bacterium]|nr:hypothetical protein [Flavobacteriaceae bacterium]
MKYILQLLVLLSVFGISYGFYLRPEQLQKGELFIGLSLVLLFFITMPIFIYRRWKGKDVKDYMLTKENILKMRKYNDSKDKK